MTSTTPEPDGQHDARVQVLTAEVATRTSDQVARRIKILRQSAGWTLEHLAQRCADIGAPQITRSILANIESGRRHDDGQCTRDVTVDELCALASALGTDAASLLGMERRISPIGAVVVRQLRSLADAIEETSQP